MSPSDDAKPTSAKVSPRKPALAIQPADKPLAETIKETLESITIALILALVFRAYVTEAFVIPTGSMAPTLLGAHFQAQDPQTGYRFTVGRQGENQVPHGIRRQVAPRETGLPLLSPMSQSLLLMPPTPRVCAGDRILVHKFVYAFSEPRRWDVVVFKNPQEPRVNYIKRLVGKPHEQLLIAEGNIYVRRTDLPESDPRSRWRIARKLDAHRRGEKVQRAVWQPVFDSRFTPVVSPSSRRSVLLTRRGQPWQSPWQVERGQWQTEDRTTFAYMGADPGEIAFDFHRYLTGVGMVASLYPYNQMSIGGVARDEQPSEPIEDIRLATTIQPVGDGAGVWLQTRARLPHTPTVRTKQYSQTKPMFVRAQLLADGTAQILAIDPDEPGRRIELARTRIAPLLPDHARHLELWYADQQISFWVDGRRELTWDFQITMDHLRERAQAPTFPDVRIGIQGGQALLSKVQLDRDLIYTSHPANTAVGRQPARGALRKAEGRSVGQPVTLAADQFFVLGDNSPNSSDGRYWQQINPWIRKRAFTHPDLAQPGVVPRRLLIGRAFFVYLPAFLSLDPDKLPFIPNFADMRFIH